MADAVRSIADMRADPRTLDEALLVFQADPPTLVKNKSGQAGNQPTKYADLVQVNRLVLSRLNALGVIFVGKPTRLPDSGVFVLDYRLTHVPSGQSESGQYPIPINENSQRMGSAISYSRRYVLNALTGVAAKEEDDDGNATSRRNWHQRAAAPRSQSGASTPAGKPQNTAQRQTQRAESEESGSDGPPLGMLPGQGGKIAARFGEVGIDSKVERLDIAAAIIHRDIGSAVEMTRDEAQRVITILDDAVTRPDPAGFLRNYLPDDTVPPEGTETP